jgi:hypothetical protein
MASGRRCNRMTPCQQCFANAGSASSSIPTKARRENRSTFMSKRTMWKQNPGRDRLCKWPTMMAMSLGRCASCKACLRPIGTGLGGFGMSISSGPMRVRFDSDSFWVDLSDGRVIGVPLAWCPRLLQGTEEQRKHARISSRGLHWDDLEEDISVAALLAGLGDQCTPTKTFAAYRSGSAARNPSAQPGTRSDAASCFARSPRYPGCP